MGVASTFLHDEGTARFFRALENQEGIPPFELLLTQRYLILHEQPINTARLQATISNLTASPGGRARLLQYAAYLRHELFVPWLISVYDNYGLNLGYQRPQGVLCEITFARGISDPEGWQEWYDKHRHESRSRWVAEALSEVDAALATSPDQAPAILRAANCHWAVPERAAIPHLKAWGEHKPIHPEIIPILFGVCHPASWQELLPVGRTIRKESHMYLFFARSARSQIQTLNFDGSDSTWERRVTRILGDEEDYQYRVKPARGGAQ